MLQLGCARVFGFERGDEFGNGVCSGGVEFDLAIGGGIDGAQDHAAQAIADALGEAAAGRGVREREACLVVQAFGAKDGLVHLCGQPLWCDWLHFPACDGVEGRRRRSALSDVFAQRVQDAVDVEGNVDGLGGGEWLSRCIHWRLYTCRVTEVSIVIPTMRGRARLPSCIDALRAQTFRDFEIVVIDNASADGSREWLAEQGDVRVIRNERNVGFAAACNQGIRASGAPFVALLNDDVRAEPGWLHALLAAMAPGVGAVASLMLFAAQPEIVQCAGICLDRAAIAWERLAGSSAVEASKSCEVFGASGGACLYRRAMLDEIGLLDEEFFAYQEDVDLAWRAQCAGWRCRYAPGARVLHDVSATSGAGSPFKHRLQGRNKIWMILKNAPLRDWPVIAFYDCAAVAYAGLVRGEWAHLRGRMEALRRARVMTRVRRGQRLISGSGALVAPWKVRERFHVL